MKRKRFIKLLIGRLLMTRNEANYIADIARIISNSERRQRPRKVTSDREIV